MLCYAVLICAVLCCDVPCRGLRDHESDAGAPSVVIWGPSEASSGKAFQGLIMPLVAFEVFNKITRNKRQRAC